MIFASHVYDVPPHSAPAHNKWSSPSFRPGDFSQDVFTLPLELGLIGALNYAYTPRSATLFPLRDELTNEPTHTTTYGGSKILPYAAGAGVLVFTGLTLTNDNFHLGAQARGFAHAILLTELATTTAKTAVQKVRPNYSEELQKNHGEDTNDMRASFFSGHSAHSFNFAAYSSLMMWEFSPSPVLATLYAVGSLGAASVIAYSRTEDHAHNATDVIVGGLAGTAISALVFFRTQHVDSELHPRSAVSQEYKWDFAPSVVNDDTGKSWYGAAFHVEL